MIKQIALVFALFTSFQSPAHVLNLIGAPRSSDEQYLSVPDSDRPDALPVVAITSHSPGPAPAPFQLSGLELDRGSYSMSDDFSFEVTLRYVGTETILFPMSVETHLFRKSMPSLHTAALAVLFTHPVLGRQIQIAERLYGSDSVSGSLISLSPNESIRIQGKGTWGLRLQVPFAESIWPITVTPVVDFNLFGSGVNHAAIASTDNPTVILSKLP